ncbi:MAG: RagB/SusD family nutrient uptake outer membrane protein [Taibaiella sp.]|nr:RagB/SusD family nutrient uptake outer membrane protein [Taibaiella sp.]
MKNIVKKITIGLLAGSSIFTLASCKKDFLNQLPTTQVPSDEVFKTTQGARAAVNGIHAMMYEGTGDHDAFGIPSIGIMSDLMCGDMGAERIGSGWFITAYWFRDRNPDNTGAYMWGYFFRMIHNANMIIANIDKATGEQEDKDNIKAQALFYRAYAYFNMANYYQFNYFDNQYMVADGNSRTATIRQSASLDDALGLPLYKAPTQTPNPRASLRETYQLITDDLDQAIALLQGAPSISRGTDKSQIDINVAKGLYARVALHMQSWTKAATFAREARQGYALMNPSDFSGGMNRTINSEWIWASEINSEANGIYASFLSHMSNDIEGAYAKAQGRLISASFFKPTILGDSTMMMTQDDYRRAWGEVITYKDSRGTDRYFVRARKFKPQKPNSFLADYVLMRAAEMYLIEAEALAHQGLSGQALSVLNEFGVTRQPSYNFQGATKEAIVKEIWKQKRIELWGEGFGFHEAKRRMTPVSTGGVTPEASISYGSGGYRQQVEVSSVPAGNSRLVFRIPSQELEQNREMIQN